MNIAPNKIHAGIASTFFLALLLSAPINTMADGNASDYDAIPPVISSTGANDKPNILVILDNSNSMDEAPNGSAVGSDNEGSKSEIARKAVKGIITTFGDSMRMGLMTYKQSGVSGVGEKFIYNSPYDASFDPANYDSTYTGSRDSLTKAFRLPNATNPGTYVYYNVALPFYSSSDDDDDKYAFCYSSTANFDNGSENPTTGPWDSYTCYRSKTNTSDDPTSGFSDKIATYTFSPTDSDYAQGILDFGKYLTWNYVGPTWFSNSSPGRGMLHVGIDDLDATQTAALNAKLATSQFTAATDTPIRNAGLTPIEGTLYTAKDYYVSGLAASEVASGTAAAVFSSGNACNADDKYVILVTDGLPSTDKNGAAISDTSTAIAAAATAAAALLTEGVRTYVIGFALPYGVDPTVLDTIASSGGTKTAYNANDSTTLNAALSSIFLNIINRASSGTGAAVLANNSRGDGAFYQALYIPKIEDALGNSTTWVGVLNSLFVDQKGYVREDSNGNDQLDGYDTDKIVEYFYDDVDARAKAYIKTSTSASTPQGLTSVTKEIADIKYIWSARDQLGEIADPTTQRAYATSAATGRTIYTSVNSDVLGDFIPYTDAELAALQSAETTANSELDIAEDNLEGINDLVDQAKTTMDNATPADYAQAKANYDALVIQQTAAEETLAAKQAAYNSTQANVVNSSFRNYMGASSLTQANDIVRYVRGEEISGFRSRKLDYNGNGSATEIWRLGDIIHSTPAVVGIPINRYDVIHQDSTYAEFVNKYYFRRNVVYVGSNDGMLHAFNSGFWNDSAKKFETTDSFANSSTSVTAHPLGTELWAYVPKAALPHLQWLTNTGYSHTYYVDGEPVVFDANIFEDDTDHPGGWGTVLVVGMRFGGGPFSVDTDGNGSKETVLRSSYSIFDVTNPEKPPILLNEITDAALGFTTSIPAVVKARVENSTTGGYTTPSKDRWLLAFGSGPTALDAGTSSQQARVYLYDLESENFLTGYNPKVLTSDTSSYVGDIGVADWNTDFVDDALYFGVNSGTAASPTGRLARLRMDSNTDAAWLSSDNEWFNSAQFGNVINASGSIHGAPHTVMDNKGRLWVYAGTGRLYVAADNSSKTQQRFYGIMEPINSSGEETGGTVSFSSLENSTNIRVFTNNEVDKSGSSFEIPSGTQITNFDQLEKAISESRGGWYIDFTYHGTGALDEPSGRNLYSATRFQETLFFTEYEPDDNTCQPEGTSNLHALHYKTGTAPPYDIIGQDESVAKNDGKLVLRGMDLGLGIASKVTITPNASDGGATLFIQKGDAELEIIQLSKKPVAGTRESWQEIDL